MPSPARQDFLHADGLAWVRGDTIPAMPFELLNDDATPVNLTGANIVMDIFDQPAGALLARLRTSSAPASSPSVPEGTITVSDATNGIGQVDQVPPTVTLALCPATPGRSIKRWYSFEITWTTPNPDVVTTAFWGWIEVLRDKG
jgi:hypothetical protein